MSPRNSESPQADIYVGLLFVSVAALTTALIFLLVELDRYGYSFPQ